MKKKWNVKPAAGDGLHAFAESAGCSDFAARLLWNRGITTMESARRFLNPSLSDLPDPFLLPDAEAAAERIKQALHKREKIAVHGDYDGDGVTSAALWYRFLQCLGAHVSVHVPHRQRDGYDIRSKFVAKAKDDEVGLIITTDCGIQAVEEVEEAREAGIDVIVTDHHTPKDEIPRAIAVVNPHRKDSCYPFRELAGVGVAFRMGEALVRHLGENVERYQRAFIDLAAIGTVTDMMPLVEDNRVIVTHGLEALRVTKKTGIQALMRSAGINPQRIGARDLGYGIGPRLNAAGRVDDSALSLQLLVTKDDSEACRLAESLERANAERRSEQDRVLAEALSLVGDSPDSGFLVVAGKNWNSGVVGLVAGKLAERFHRPAIVIAMDDEEKRGKGSARSIPAYNVHEAMTACSEHLQDFGGHAQAAGLSINLADLDGFRDAMNRRALESLTEEDLTPQIDADMDVNPAEISFSLMQELKRFEPWGCGNEEPTLISHGLQIQDVKRIGKEMQHLKLVVTAEGLRPTDACWWGRGDLADQFSIGNSISACYRPDLNHFNGQSRVQFVLHDTQTPD